MQSLREPLDLSHDQRPMLQGIEACYSTQLLSFHLDLSMDAIVTVISLVFLALIAILYLLQVSPEFQLGPLALAVPQLEHLYLWQTADWVVFLPSMINFLSCFFRASVITCLRKILKREASLPNSIFCSKPFFCAAVHMNCTCSLAIDLRNGAN